ncbi:MULTISPECIES: helix-turn-helix domain-containing protein [unclassified Streptomyces]|uniref:helix-turn-helix domain-containing protein n=1 Tax=unclassified Streptomyces TaxID=2593676 RepID=UPI001BEC5BB4|nr:MULTISPECIES: helix-turn-helix transcriptional regulator [unclassified Streptomyces]MBT2408102.1 transcriptional regulator [Streptomyces sp. ISL-21]MBT2609552.1 transcriptional regulator [Streptomyces sp. ISL-87]
MYSTPFSPVEARSARARMGLTTAQVAQSMAACGTPVHPDLVASWEHGSRLPSDQQLFTLADVLWCDTTALMGVEPRTLAEYRLARQLTVERLAYRIGMDPHEYRAAEAAQNWHGDTWQTRALVEALGLSLRKLIGIMGRVDELAGHLRTAIGGRWKVHVDPVAEIVVVDATSVGDALRTMHAEFSEFSERYMGHLVALNDDARLKEITAERAAYLTRLVDHFWELIGEAGEAPPFPTGGR